MEEMQTKVTITLQALVLNSDFYLFIFLTLDVFVVHIII